MEKVGDLFRLTSCRQLNYLDSFKLAEETLPKSDFRTKHFLGQSELYAGRTLILSLST